MKPVNSYLRKKPSTSRFMSVPYYRRKWNYKLGYCTWRSMYPNWMHIMSYDLCFLLKTQFSSLISCLDLHVTLIFWNFPIDLLNEVELDSSEYTREVLPIIQQSYRDPLSKNKFSYSKVQLVHNSALKKEVGNIVQLHLLWEGMGILSKLVQGCWWCWWF